MGDDRRVDLTRVPEERRQIRESHREESLSGYAFDLVADYLRQQWSADGLGSFGQSREEHSALSKAAILASFAGAYGVSFERFADAVRPLLGTSWQEFMKEHVWYLADVYHRYQEQYALSLIEGKQPLPDGPPHPWPSEIAKTNRQDGRDHGKSGGAEKANGKDTGHSM